VAGKKFRFGEPSGVPCRFLTVPVDDKAILHHNADEGGSCGGAKTTNPLIASKEKCRKLTLQSSLPPGDTKGRISQKAALAPCKRGIHSEKEKSHEKGAKIRGFPA